MTRHLILQHSAVEYKGDKCHIFFLQNKLGAHFDRKGRVSWLVVSYSGLREDLVDVSTVRAVVRVGAAEAAAPFNLLHSMERAEARRSEKGEWPRLTERVLRLGSLNVIRD